MPELYAVPNGPFAAKLAGRVIVDSNVISAVLRRMIGERRTLPEHNELAGLLWLQSYLLSRRVGSRLKPGVSSWSMDFGHAVTELSRDRGRVDVDRFSRLVECGELLYDWVEAGVVQTEITTHTPLRRPRKRLDVSSVDIDDHDHSHAAVALLEMYKINRAREAGEFTSPSAGMAALVQWEQKVWPSGMLTAEVVSAAIYAALGSYTAPQLALCKFSQYKSPASALSLAWNAAWDFHFMHMVRCSSLGLQVYQGVPRRTTFITYDKALAAASRSTESVSSSLGGLSGAYARIDHSQFRRNVRQDARVLEHLGLWQQEIAVRQRARVQSGEVLLWSHEEARRRRDTLLSSLFP